MNNMQSYKLSNVIDKPTSTGKSKKEATITSENGETTEKVGIWSDFPDFANLKDGTVVMGKIKTSPDGKWTNLVYASETPKTGNSGAYKQKVMNEAMEKKERSISQFQTNKEENIKLASTLRMAVDIVTAFDNKAQISIEEIKKEIQYWREWLWFEWEKPIDQKEGYPPFK